MRESAKEVKVMAEEKILNPELKTWVAGEEITKDKLNSIETRISNIITALSSSQYNFTESPELISTLTTIKNKIGNTDTIDGTVINAIT